MKRVLVLQHIWGDTPGSLSEMMRARDIPFDLVEVDKAPIPDGSAYAAIIVLGGGEYAGDDARHPYLLQEKALIHKALAQDIPFLGICLGGQLLAYTLGAQVRRHALTEIGFYEVELTAEGRNDPLLQGLPGYQQVFHWHSDTFDLPPGGVLLAATGPTPQAFRYGHRAYGLQYHIELTPDMLTIWLKYHPDRQEAIELLGQEGYDQIERERATRYPIYAEHTRILFENFLKIAELL